MNELLTHTRYSCREYSPAPVSADAINAVLDQARFAPSACNRQPWRIMVIGPDDKEGRSAVCASYDRPWIVQAPYYLIICGVESEAWVRPYDGKCHLDIDVAIITEHICLAAADSGLGTCWVCNFDPKVLTDGIEFPQGVTPMVIVPIGLPAGTTIPEKKRKSLEDILI